MRSAAVAVVVVGLSTASNAQESSLEARATDDAETGFDFDELDEIEEQAAGNDEDELEAEEDGGEDAGEEEGVEDHPYGEIEELTVRGRQGAGLSDLDDADAVTSFDAKDIEALGISDVTGLANFTPNLEIIAANPTAPTFFIRGVGLSDFNANSTGAVAIFLDDVALNAPALQSALLFDVERVNVLKGPQGTGPNRNASAGAIKTYSRLPSNEFGGSLRGSYGNYNFIDLEGGIDMPIVDGVLLSRTSFRFTRRDGTGTNRCGDAPPDDERVPRDPGVVGSGSICEEFVRPNRISDLPTGLRTTVNDQLAGGARIQLRYTPDLWSMDWLLNGHMTIRDQLAPLGQGFGIVGVQRAHDGSPDVQGILGGQTSSGYTGKDVREMVITRRDELRDEGLPFGEALDLARLDVADELAENLDIRPREGDYNRTGDLQNFTAGGSVRGDIPLGDLVDFTSISAFDYYERDNDQDLDSTPDELFELINDDEGWQFIQDFRFSGDANEWLGWKAGAYYLTEKIDAKTEALTGDSPLGFSGVSDRGYTQKLHSWAAYGSVEIDFWDDLNFLGGLRYNWERKNMDYGLILNTIPKRVQDAKTWSAPTWTLRLTYSFSDLVEIYGKYDRGWKGGHFNAVGNLNQQKLDFADPETLDAWEAGFRGMWFDQKLGLDASFFYYRYKDYQVFTFNQGFNVQPELIITNANDAENYGAEVDLTLNPIDDLLGIVRFGWLESRYLDFTQENVLIAPGVNGQVVEYPVLVDYTGNRLINSPQFQLTFMGQYELGLGRFGSLIPRYDSTWKSASYFDASEGVGPPNAFQGEPILPPNTLGQGPFWLHNARLTWSVMDWDTDVSFWVRNFMDETYKAGGFNATAFSSLVVLFVGEPRTFGFDVNARF